MTICKRVFIYGLFDPRDGNLKYIGKANNVAARLKQHISGRRDQKQTKKTAWITSLSRKGLTPDICVIDECNEQSWEECEQFWIAYFRAIGADLVNTAIGGAMPLCEIEVRRRNGKKTSSGREKGIWALLRYLGAAKAHFGNIGDIEKKSKMELAAAKVKGSVGHTRDRLNAYAFDRGIAH